MNIPPVAMPGRPGMMPAPGMPGPGAADTVTVHEGASVLCGGALSSFHPVDCASDPGNPNFFSAGFVNVVLTKTSY